MVVQNVNYNALSRNENLMAAFKSKMTAAIAREAGVNAAAVDVKLSRGSVRVQALIQPALAIHPEKILHGLQKKEGSLGPHFEELLAKIPGIDEVCTGKPHVAGVNAKNVRADKIKANDEVDEILKRAGVKEEDVKKTPKMSPEAAKRAEKKGGEPGSGSMSWSWILLGGLVLFGPAIAFSIYLSNDAEAYATLSQNLANLFGGAGEATPAAPQSNREQVPSAEPQAA